MDESALEVGSRNVGGFEDMHIEFVRADVRALPLRRAGWDTVLTNPPFGTRQKGADMAFLAAACAVARTAVYSLHKARASRAARASCCSGVRRGCRDALPPG